MSKQVLSIEQMQHLKELGVDISKAYMCWVCLNSEPYLSFYSKKYPHEDTKVIPAFTLQDIWDLLPSETGKDEKTSTIDILKHPTKYILCFWRGELLFKCENSILIDAAYEMLCWVIDNGYLKFE